MSCPAWLGKSRAIRFRSICSISEPWRITRPRNRPGLDSEPLIMPIHAHHNRHPQLQAVIFDMDGFIIDSHPAHRRAWRKFLYSMGRNVTNHELDFILDGRKRAEILR